MERRANKNWSIFTKENGLKSKQNKKNSVFIFMRTSVVEYQFSVNKIGLIFASEQVGKFLK